MWFRLWTLCNAHLPNWTLPFPAVPCNYNIPYLFFSVPAFRSCIILCFLMPWSIKSYKKRELFPDRRRNAETYSLKGGRILRKRSVLNQSDRVKLKNGPTGRENEILRNEAKSSRKETKRDCLEGQHCFDVCVNVVYAKPLKDKNVSSGR